ncbi:phage regulatory protein/antirepressor Ant [Corynebacterium belfantii]|uniref:phage regulatory protein/antirepressor Ant n=1 Tax=Corynebacterium belfantii TaxID=2014537 RepID=UPI0018D2CF6C|nr:phage regulatory protein/antirepressor Ant [Corynebacterium belfantii]MBG9309888.1 phage regulatory protein/antirepressor Ant [Corynebacterium belfantii]
MTTELVHAAPNGELSTTSEIIAGGVGIQHKNVLETIRKNQADFEEFGRVAFETRTRQTAGGPQKTNIAVLNREQAMFAMTLFRNTPVVVDFKKNLIKAFVTMEHQLECAEQSPAFDPASLTRAEILQIALNAEEERLALEAKNKELAPKADAYESFIDTTGKYSIGAVAKMLGMGQNKLFRELRNLGVLISKGAMRNTPYQQYMHHFEVKAHEYERTNGEMGCSYTTYVQPSGIDFIRKKLDLPTIDPLPEAA